MTRQESIEKLTTPTGRVFEIVHWDVNPALYVVKYGDKIPGELPDKLKDHRFTSRTKATKYLKDEILSKAWDHAEEHSPKRAKVA